MDFSKSVIPSHLLGDRSSNLVVINPGSANVRIGLAQQDAPFSIPHCIAWCTTGANQSPRKNVQDQNLNSQVTTAQHVEREKAYDIIASLLKIPFLDEEVVNNSYPRKMGRVDVLSQQNSKKESMLTWTDVFQKSSSSSLASESSSHKHETSESPEEGGSDEKPQANESKYKEYICGEEAMRISPTEPYCLRRPIRRGHLNISQHYSMQQVLEDLQTIWDWILVEKLHISHSERNMYSALIVVPETFDNREIKEILSIVLRDLRFGSAVVHQEGLAAVFGNGLSTACVVNIGAQVTSVICVEDGVALPHTQITLRFGGEDVSRCLLWTQRHHQTWPPIRTDALAKPIDLLMLNRLKESYCQIYEGEVEAVGVVHSYEDGLPPGSHKTRLTALNVAPMGLFYPTLLVPDVYPPPPRSWFKDYEDMLEDTWHIDFPRRSDISDGLYPGNPLQMWDNYPYPSNQQKKEDNIGLAEAITKSILSTGRIDLQRKLFCSMQLIGGVALTTGLISAMEERVLHAIPSNEAIDTVEVLQPRTNPSFVAWRGGAILGVIDYGREAWIHREDWIQNGIHIAGGRKYKDSYYLQAQPMCYINSHFPPFSYITFRSFPSLNPIFSQQISYPSYSSISPNLIRWFPMADSQQPPPPPPAVTKNTTTVPLPNFLLSVKLKYVKLGYHYLISHAMYLLLTPILAIISIHLSTLTSHDMIHLWNQLRFNLVTVVLCSALMVFLATLYFMSRPKKVYLVDFACYKPEDARMVTRETFMDRSTRAGTFTDENLAFQKKILERSGLGQKTYFPEAVLRVPPNPCMAEARKEAEMVMYGAIDELLAKTGVKAKDIGILIVNCSLFCPTPSLTSMVVNHYKLRGNIMSYNLGGMGCSAGLISIDLAKQLLQVNPNSYALVVSMENITLNWYFGNNRSMLVSNCLFRMGGAAVLLSNRSSDRHRSKYQLIHTVRTHKGADDRCYNCVFQEEDENKKIGVALSKDLMAVAGEALKTNITTLGPLVLPMSEQLLFFATLVARKVFQMKIKPYIPDFKLAFEHFCIHAGGRAVLDELEKNLDLSDWHMEPSRMTLNRFGNTSSSSLWYELAYSEAKGRIRKGDRSWQIAFGSGFKCNSAVWKALKTIDPTKEKNPWTDEIDDFPVHVPKIERIGS